MCPTGEAAAMLPPTCLSGQTALENIIVDTCQLFLTLVLIH